MSKNGSFFIVFINDNDDSDKHFFIRMASKYSLYVPASAYFKTHYSYLKVR